jgi:hypothetical protein
MKYHVYATNQETEDGDLEIRVITANSPNHAAETYLDLYKQDLDRTLAGKIVVLLHQFLHFPNGFTETTVFFITPVVDWELKPQVQ